MHRHGLAVVKDLAALIQRIPKADIHVHFEGLISRQFMRARSDRESPLNDRSIFRTSYGGLSNFVDACRLAVRVLRSEDDCFELVRSYLRSANDDGVVHVELAIEPELHESRGLSRALVLSGVRRALAWGRERLGISSFLILSLRRDGPLNAAVDSVRALCEDPQDFVAVGLASRELGYPPTPFARAFDTARKAGLRVVVHAGEEGPPSYIWSSVVDLEVDRIDHGLRSFEDEELVALLEARQIPLALAPISNLKTGCLIAAGTKALDALLHSNLLVSINSDDPGILGAGIVQNFEWACMQYGLTTNDVARLARNSIMSSFLPEEQKGNFIQLIERARV